jgi:hypothetical protein
MAFHLKLEALSGSRTWFARVPTECNLSDYPPRGVDHALLVDCCKVTTKAFKVFEEVLQFLQSGDDVLGEGGSKSTHPPLEKKVSAVAACLHGS